MSNIPVCWQNVIDYMDEWPAAQQAFLWAAVRKDKTSLKYRAEGYALEVIDILGLDNIFEMSQSLYGFQNECQRNDLMRFTLKRHATQFWGSECKMWWE